MKILISDLGDFSLNMYKVKSSKSNDRGLNFTHNQTEKCLHNINVQGLGQVVSSFSVSTCRKDNVINNCKKTMS